MADEVQLPQAFDASLETNKFLARIKTRAANNFSWKKQPSFESSLKMAYWLYVFEKEDEALEVCRFLGTYQFAGNFRHWIWVEFALALQSRIVRRRGNLVESKDCLKRIPEAGFVSDRLEGSMLKRKLESLQEANAANDKTGEQNWSLSCLHELCVLSELGGSETLPVEALEQQFQEILARLQTLVR